MFQLEPGRVVGRYQIIGEIGQGGMARVYRAKHTTLGSDHAVKLLLIPSEHVKKRMLREGRVQARLNHPNVVGVSDILDVNGVPALVMDFINGPPLDEWLDENRPSISSAMRLFAGILAGVEAAHNAGVIHRDLKPANVMLEIHDGTLVPRVTDFGLVKDISDMATSVTNIGTGMGTPQYMAPEQIRNASAVDQRADLFSLGCILYELVCGVRAFDGSDALTIFNKVAHGEYIPPEKIRPELPKSVVSAIHRLLRTDRDRRPVSCKVVRELIYGRTSGEGWTATLPDEDEITPVESPLKQKASTWTPERPDAEVTDVRQRPPSLRPESMPPKSLPPEEEQRNPLLLTAASVTVLTMALLSVGAIIGVVQLWSVPDIDLEPADLSEVVRPRPELVDTEPAPAPAPEPRAKRARPRPTAEPGKGKGKAKGKAATPEPQPDPVPAPPAAETGTVTFAGDAKSVRLVKGGVTKGAGAVAVGEWVVMADFGDGPARAGRVTITSGKAVTVTCSSFARQCKGR